MAQLVRLLVFAALTISPRHGGALPRVRPTLLTIPNNAELDDIISRFMTTDEFIPLVAQANLVAHAQSRVAERRFRVRIEHGVWAHRDVSRGPRAETEH